MHAAAAVLLLAAGIAVLLLWQQQSGSRSATLRPRMLRSLQPQHSDMSATEGATFSSFQNDGGLFSHQLTQLCSKLAGAGQRQVHEPVIGSPPVTAAHQGSSPGSARGGDRFGDQYLALGMLVKVRTLSFDTHYCTRASCCSPAHHASH